MVMHGNSQDISDRHAGTAMRLGPRSAAPPQRSGGLYPIELSGILIGSSESEIGE
jgi:hypothetical protein